MSFEGRGHRTRKPPSSAPASFDWRIHACMRSDTALHEGPKTGLQSWGGSLEPEGIRTDRRRGGTKTEAKERKHSRVLITLARALPGVGPGKRIPQPQHSIAGRPRTVLQALDTKSEGQSSYAEAEGATAGPTTLDTPGNVRPSETETGVRDPTPLRRQPTVQVMQGHCGHGVPRPAHAMRRSMAARARANRAGMSGARLRSPEEGARAPSSRPRRNRNRSGAAL